jgi:hypothetical protein
MNVEGAEMLIQIVYHFNLKSRSDGLGASSPCEVVKVAERWASSQQNPFWPALC